MDPKWVEAVKAGDVEFLRKILGEYKRELDGNNGDYTSSCFLSHYHVGNEDIGNILHLAAMEGEEKIFDEIIRNLPDLLVHPFLTQHNYDGQNPLHLAAESGHHGIVKMIMRFYMNLNSKSEVIQLEAKPWLALDSSNQTPLHTALWKDKEECALEILTPLPDEHEENNKDLEELCNMEDKYDSTPLFIAIRRGLNRVALHILRFSPSYKLIHKDGCTPFHYVGRCTEEVLKLLLEKHPDLIKEVNNDGYTVVDHWINEDNIWALDYILKSINDFPAALQLIKHLAYLGYACNNGSGGNIFHLFASRRMLEASTTLAQIYREVRAKEITSFEGEANQLLQLPWLLPNQNGISPLEITITNDRTASDEYKRLKSDLFGMESAVKGKFELLFIAIKKGLYHAAEAIWYVQHTYGWWCLYPPQSRQFWHAALMFSEEAAIWVVEKLPSLTSEHEDVKYVLCSATLVGAAGFIEWMLKKDPSVLELVPTVWVEACKRGHFSAVKAFIDHCPDFREICIQQKDTPLHHIKFKGYKQCLNFLKDPIVLALKNFQDRNGETPLHKSIKNRNLLLTEVLLTTDDVIRSIEDNDHKTAMDLLVKACMESREWDEMCKRNGIVPGLQTTYFQDKTNLLEVRNTLSVVAALLATITFTAGFTLPGGVQSDSSGKPTLGNKAAFLVFLLADTLAMCSSMLVLVCLLWSMLCDHNRSLLLIDKSMPVLLLALYSTLVAFMTGVYVVIPHKSLWSAIVVLGMCSIFIILSKRWIMYKLLDKFNPAMDRKYSDELSMMEQGEATTFLGYRSSRIHERAITSTGTSGQRAGTSIGASSPQQN